MIDCGTYIAGPAAASIMADFGAEVIKIERPPHGDPYRYLSKIPGAPLSDHLYCWILDGRNRKSVALNLEDDAARDALLKLVRTADVFITNYQPALVRKFRLGYSELRPLNERLIYAHVTGYGETGADVDEPGYDQTAYWARSGLMYTMYNADGEPCRALGREDLIEDQRFRTPALRQANSTALIRVIDEVVATKDMEEWSKLFREHEIIFALMQTNEETARDRQMEANGVFAEIAPGMRTVSSPFVVEGVEKTKPTMAPQVGEHTAEVLLGLGYSAAEIADLDRRGAAMTGKGSAQGKSNS